MTNINLANSKSNLMKYLLYSLNDFVYKVTIQMHFECGISAVRVYLVENTEFPVNSKSWQLSN